MSTVIEIVEARLDQYAGRIRTAWQKGVVSILETGRLLIEAKRELPGGFYAMVAEQLPFSPGTAWRLMAIAEHAVLSDAAHVPCLPPAWGTLYELTKLPDAVLRAKLADGTINPKLERNTVTAMLSEPEYAAVPDEEPTIEIDRRSRVVVPEGKTVADMCRVAARFQADGESPKEAARQAGLSERAFREGWTVVQLSDRNDLGERDAELARKATAEMNETRRTHRPFVRVAPIADRIWGKKARRDDTSRKLRIEEFVHATTVLADTCTRAGDINIPHLTDDQVKQALKRLKEAQAGLRTLTDRIKRSRL